MWEIDIRTSTLKSFRIPIKQMSGERARLIYERIASNWRGVPSAPPTGAAADTRQGIHPRRRQPPGWPRPARRGAGRRGAEQPARLGIAGARAGVGTGNGRRSRRSVLRRQRRQCTHTDTRFMYIQDGVFRETPGMGWNPYGNACRNLRSNPREDTLLPIGPPVKELPYSRRAGRLSGGPRAPPRSRHLPPTTMEDDQHRGARTVAHALVRCCGAAAEHRDPRPRRARRCAARRDRAAAARWHPSFSASRRGFASCFARGRRAPRWPYNA